MNNCLDIEIQSINLESWVSFHNFNLMNCFHNYLYFLNPNFKKFHVVELRKYFIKLEVIKARE